MAQAPAASMAMLTALRGERRDTMSDKRSMVPDAREGKLDASALIVQNTAGNADQAAKSPVSGF
jgi:hypothetical protein